MAAARPKAIDRRGLGLPGMLQAVLGRGDDLFTTIRDELIALFPHVKALRVPAVSEQTAHVRVDLRDGTTVTGDQLSEGLLYFLAFAVLRHAEKVRLFLVEEPENGLHPSRIADVVRVLRDLSTRSQVLIATHSPLVINELRPEEVTLVTRPSEKQGTVLTPLAQTKNFSQRSKVYALGELWLSYADGNTETELTGVDSGVRGRLVPASSC